MSEHHYAGSLPTGVVALTDRGHLAVQGADAESFLQAMLTQDVQAMDVQHSVYSAFCSAKGRCHAFMLVTRLGAEHFVLSMPAELVGFVQKRLQMFVLRRDVTTYALEDYQTLGVLLSEGQQWPAIDGVAGLDLSQAAWLQTQPLDSGWLVVEQHQGSCRRVTTTVPSPQACEIKAQLAEALGTITIQDFERAEIIDRIPAVYSATESAFVPQWMNLEKLDAFSLKKGCYPGQEVIARLHYLGKSNRQLFAGHALAAKAFTPGTEIINQEDKPVGEIVRSVALGEDCQFLAVVKLKHLHDALKIADTPVTLEHIAPQQAAFADTTH